LVVVATIQVKMLEGLSGEGFHEQVTLPWLSRQLMTQEIPLVGKFFEWGGHLLHHWCMSYSKRGCHSPAKSGVESLKLGILERGVFSLVTCQDSALESFLLFFTWGRLTEQSHSAKMAAPRKTESPKWWLCWRGFRHTQKAIRKRNLVRTQHAT